MSLTSLQSLMNQPITYQTSNMTVKRSVKAGSIDKKGKTWLLVDTDDGAGKSDIQWVEASIFEAWLSRINSTAAA